MSHYPAVQSEVAGFEQVHSHVSRYRNGVV
jgi:hypothetical protein